MDEELNTRQVHKENQAHRLNWILSKFVVMWVMCPAQIKRKEEITILMINNRGSHCHFLERRWLHLWGSIIPTGKLCSLSLGARVGFFVPAAGRSETSTQSIQSADK